jgi:hypothetical protein
LAPPTRCKLTLDPNPTVKQGRTFFTDDGTPCLRPTAVFIPPGMDVKDPVNVVLYLHGFKVKSHKHLFNIDPTQTREQVLKSGKKVVLIAPFVGYEYWVTIDPKIKAADKTKKDHWAGDYPENRKALAKDGWGERYLDEVLAAIAAVLSPDKPMTLGVGNLVIAAHSGGGESMFAVIGSLGKYRTNLKECWGLDCLYSDHTESWINETNGKSAFVLRVFFGESTAYWSIKLYLAGRGLATTDGRQATSQIARDDRIVVVIGGERTVAATGAIVNKAVHDAKTDAAEMQGIVDHADPVGNPKKHKDNEFVDNVYTSVMNNHSFPKDIHYIVARDCFMFALHESSLF